MEEQPIQDYVNEIYAINYLPSNKNIETLLPKISNVDGKRLNKLLKSVIKKHPYIYLSTDAEVTKDANLAKIWDRHRVKQDARRKSYLEERCKIINQSEYAFLTDKLRDNFPYDYEELLNLAVMLPSWMEDHEHTIEDIIQILIYIGYPSEFEHVDRIKEFFEFVRSYASVIQIEETKLIQAFLIWIQEYKSTNRFESIVYLSQFYPFTDESVDELIKWITGEYHTKVTKDGIDYDVYADDYDFTYFAECIVDALVPDTFNFTYMMIKHWILLSKEQVNGRLGSTLSNVLYQNIDHILFRLKLDGVWGYDIQDVNYDTYFLGEYIKNHHNDLTPEILDELMIESAFYEISEDCKDNISVSSFRADTLALGVENVEVSWANVEFCKSYIVVHLKLEREKLKDFTYRLECNYSSSSMARIITENKILEIAVNQRLPNIHCAFNRYGIIAILNKEQILQSMQAIAEVCEIIEPGVNSSYCNSANSFLLSLKNQCYDFLIKQSLSKYETVLLKEKSQSHSGASQEENAAIFVVKDDGYKLHVVYESECLARSTYVFVTSKDAYLSLVRAIKKYFMSNEANKRQKLISDASIFRNIDGVSSVRRINHNNMDSWRMEVMR